MNDLIALLWAHLCSDEGPEIYDENGDVASDERLLEVAQNIAEAIVAAGWPRKEANP